VSGSLVVVGTGYNVAGHVTPEARALIEGAERFFYLVTDPVTSAWLRTLNGSADSVSTEARTAENRVGAASENVTSAASAVEELAASIGEIAGQAAKSKDVAGLAVAEAKRTEQTMGELGTAATRRRARR